MEYIRDIHARKAAAGQPVVSFEFFPPKTEEGDRTLLEKTIPALKALRPDYCSVTYGAGGGTRDKTLMIVDRIQREHGLTAMCHLTCVNATVEDLRGVLLEARRLGVKNILALRGDPPGASAPFPRTEGGFEYSYQLVRFIKELGGFGIGTAGFPEGHIACKEGTRGGLGPFEEQDRLRGGFRLDAAFLQQRGLFPPSRLPARERRHRADNSGHYSDPERASNQAIHRLVRRGAAGPAAGEPGELHG